MGIKPISFLVANLVAELIAMLVAQCERTLKSGLCSADVRFSIVDPPNRPLYISRDPS